ncbi:DNA polymerase III gamma/tau subunit [Kitasatospora herbaricolor]|uniref:hypothetical protein n=1 Tax=Kitasatospora herbaricolor TaxID=68217 RepID=UPI00174DE1C7|nr:hypothetical protein [Kitasatospora herbaricolor]MDQ0305723.1 DNA polymerase III gamma/tau subunit [Kitasatospora herbaricolor]
MGSTIALLEDKLPGVRERRRQLEDELAAVIAQEDAMVGVLQGLQTLSGTVLDGGPTNRQGAAATPGTREVVAEVTGAGPASDSAPEVAEPSVGAAGGPVDEEPASRPEPEPAAAKTVRKRAAKKTARSTPGSAGAAMQAPATKTTARKATAKKSAAAGEATDAAAAVPSAAEPATAENKGTARAAGKATAKKATAEKPAPATKTATAEKTAAKKTAVAADQPAPAEEGPVASVPAAPSGRRRKLTDATSVLAVLAGASGPLRAREVSGLLGLDDEDASVNAVRTMLERLAKIGKAQRSGRGLYVAAAD